MEAAFCVESLQLHKNILNVLNQPTENQTSGAGFSLHTINRGLALLGYIMIGASKGVTSLVDE